ncbi:hypothetical protein [Streptomyces sp. NPDC000851]
MFFSEGFLGAALRRACTCYQRYGTARALCNAHLLRDLDAITGQDPVGRAGVGQGRRRRTHRGEHRLRERPR